jgi:hypothetical protein
LGVILEDILIIGYETLVPREILLPVLKIMELAVVFGLDERGAVASCGWLRERPWLRRLLAVLHSLFIVFGQAPPPAESAECFFNNPSARDYNEACRSGDAADDDQRQTEQKAGQQESWLWKSEQRDKWSFCLKAASMRAAQEKP